MRRPPFRRLIPWLIASFAATIILALFVYSRLGDSYVVSAITTSPPSEEKSFDLASLSGLSALGSGGQRTTFEEFGFLIGSEANVRATITEPGQARALSEFVAPGTIEKSLLGIEQWARELFSKAPKVVDPLDRLVRIAQKRIEVKKTPEGYLAITLTGAQPYGKVELVRALIARADAAVRERAIADYRGRIATYQRLIDAEQRPAERAILVALVAREYTTYASAQSGRVFAFDYVDAPLRATKIYGPSFVLVLIGAVALWIAACAAYLVARGSLLRP